MLTAEFEPAAPARERLQTHAVIKKMTGNHLYKRAVKCTIKTSFYKKINIFSQLD
jgi:hypothetical protein